MRVHKGLAAGSAAMPLYRCVTIHHTPPMTDALGVRARVLVRVFLFWVLWFAVARFLFLVHALRETQGLTPTLLAGVWAHGVRMDLSAAGYLSLIPWLVLVLLGHTTAAVRRALLTGYFALVLVFTSLVTVVDLQVSSDWKHRLDATLLGFLRTPAEAAASSASSPWILLSGLLVVLCAASLVIARRLVVRPASAASLGGLRAGVTVGVLGVLLLVPIRGGTQWTPLNPSFAYFSTNEFANNAALNASWHFVYDAIEASRAPVRNPYVVASPAAATAAVEQLWQRSPNPARALLRLQRPNVILVVWESLTAKVVARLGGATGVTPQLEELMHDGILFDSLFASGERTPQGLIALLSSYPALPHQQVLGAARAMESLPVLSRSLGAAGWHSSFFYGGELEFANLQTYTAFGRFDSVVGELAFPARDRNSKWGAHDHVLLARALRDLSIAPRPFFSTILTLSSHEPFEIPAPPVFAGASEDTLFLNAHHYTDQALRTFVDAARRQSWWDSTLIVVVADHGSPRPSAVASHHERLPDRYHIPMLWLGGALAVRDTVVHTVGSQLDVTPTLLGQLGLDAADYRWGKDLMTRADGGFAFFAYRDGFGLVDARGWVVYDALGRHVLQMGGSDDASRVVRGAALLQTMFDDFLGLTKGLPATPSASQPANAAATPAGVGPTPRTRRAADRASTGS